MGRHIFAEHGFQVNHKVLPFEDFRLYCDQPEGFRIHPDRYPAILAQAEKRLGEEIPQLLASEYRMFRENGNRTVFENKYFPRRKQLLDLALGEYVEGKGRFLNKLIDILWLILEESTWVLPAHIGRVDKTLPSAILPDDTDTRVHHVDLFAATTGGALAFVIYLLRPQLDTVSPVLVKRTCYELNRRLIEPFLDERDCWLYNGWTGVRGNAVNNWNPWIVSNLLTVAALTTQDLTTRTVVVDRAMQMLDRFTAVYHDDGGCDEGPGYWNVAGGALFSACEVLYDMTGGYVDIFRDPLMVAMGEYAVKIQITSGRVINFADASSSAAIDPMLLYHWGKASGSDAMAETGKWMLQGKLSAYPIHDWLAYRTVKYLTEGTLGEGKRFLPKQVYLDGIQVAVTRETGELDKGLYLAVKGGHNDESHNHNDLGNFIVFADESPLFLDAGVGTYTKRTFDERRYTIWSACSDYHNCASINGVTQKAGRMYAASVLAYDEATGAIALDLTGAYPVEAGLTAYTRRASLIGGCVTVEDELSLAAPGSVQFHLLTAKQPEQLTAHGFVLQGRNITYDERLDYTIEACDCSWPETACIPVGWGTETLWRITLTAREPIAEGRFTLTVQ